jgi:hypothetical protein
MVRQRLRTISRADALELGLPRYFSGSPCCRGHVAERLVSNRLCIMCERERFRQRYREQIRERLRASYRARIRNQHNQLAAD